MDSDSGGRHVIGPFLRVPRALIESGALSDLPGAAARTWLLALWKAGPGRSANPLKRDLVRLGMGVRTAERAIASLVRIGAIAADGRGGGRGRVAQYMIGKPYPPFGRFPSDACLCRLLASSGKALAATYLVLASHANEAFQCFPGVELIAKLAGGCTFRVSEALRTLESLGVLVVTPRRKSQGEPTVYRLLRPHAHAGVSEEKHRSWCAQRPVVARINTGLSVVQEKSLQKSVEQIRADSCAADVDLGRSIEDALAAADIRDPARARLVAAFEGIPNAVKVVRDTIAEVQDRDGRTGAIIGELEKLADRETLALARRERQRARDDAVTKELHEDEDRVRTSNSVLFEHLSAIPRNEWSRVKKLALKTMPSYHQEVLRDANPERNPVLARAMIDVWNAENDSNLPLAAETVAPREAEIHEKPSEKRRVDAAFAS